MSFPSRIAILGLGGVGGYIGGKLAAKYAGSDEHEIIFIARGAHGEAIRQHGLKLITDNETVIAAPAIVSDQPEKIGAPDVIFCCIKSYDLESSLESLRSCISGKTIIISLLNGVDGPARIRKLFPGTEVWDGCIYLVSRLTEPGVIREMGNIGRLFFEAETADAEKLQQVCQLLQDAGLNAATPENIQSVVWEKFIFISSIATLTSALDRSIGEILSDENQRNVLQRLLEEIKAVAGAKKIPLPENIIAQTLQRFATLPAATTSSMHSDFSKGKNTEVESLTGFVARLGRELQVPVPEFERLYRELLTKQKDR